MNGSPVAHVQRATCPEADPRELIPAPQPARIAADRLRFLCWR